MVIFYGPEALGNRQLICREKWEEGDLEPLLPELHTLVLKLFCLSPLSSAEWRRVGLVVADGYDIRELDLKQALPKISDKLNGHCFLGNLHTTHTQRCLIFYQEIHWMQTFFSKITARRKLKHSLPL